MDIKDIEKKLEELNKDEFELKVLKTQYFLKRLRHSKEVFGLIKNLENKLFKKVIVDYELTLPSDTENFYIKINIDGDDFKPVFGTPEKFYNLTQIESSVDYFISEFERIANGANSQTNLISFKLKVDEYYNSGVSIFVRHYGDCNIENLKNVLNTNLDTYYDLVCEKINTQIEYTKREIERMKKHL